MLSVSRGQWGYLGILKTAPTEPNNRCDELKKMKCGKKPVTNHFFKYLNKINFKSLKILS